MSVRNGTAAEVSTGRAGSAGVSTGPGRKCISAAPALRSVSHQPHVPFGRATTRSSHFGHQVVISSFPWWARKSWCATNGAPRSAATLPGVAAVPPRTPAARDAMAAREDIEVTLWRRTEIFEWMLAEGPKTIVEIKDRFDLTQNVAAADVAALRAEGRLERTGVDRQGPRRGRPSAEYRVVTAEPPADEPPVPDELLGASGEVVDDDGEEKSIGERISERRDLGLTIDPTPFGDRPGASEETRRISEEVRREVEGHHAAEEIEPAAPITLHEQLVVRYIGVLIGWVERSAFVRDQGPPDHVYDRIERLLQIQDGAA